MNYTTVRIRLHRGDARNVVAPLAVIGDRSPLRTWVEHEHGAVFEVRNVRPWYSFRSSPIKYAMPVSGPWRHVITVRTNVRRRRGTRLSDDLAEALNYAIGQWAPPEIVVLPLTWRDPDAVALNTLAALWRVVYFRNSLFSAPWTDPLFILASLDGTDRYRAALEHNATDFYDWLSRIWERDVVSLLGPEHTLDTNKVVFEWS